MIDLNKAIAATIKTGKILLGTNNAIKNIKTGRAKLVIVASNTPNERMEHIKRYCKLSNIPVTIYKGTSIDLGAVCGKPFKVSTLVIRETGDSEILRLVERGNG